MPTVSVKKWNEDESPTSENDISLEYPDGENLFEFLQDNNVTLPHGCLNGACSACRVIIIKGNEFLKIESETEKETLDKFKKNYLQKNGSISFADNTIRLSCQVKFIGGGDIILAPL